jgi:hypothetical protein
MLIPCSLKLGTEQQRHNVEPRQRSFIVLVVDDDPRLGRYRELCVSFGSAELTLVNN